MTWKRFRSSKGTIYYQANISDTIILQIWEETNWWHWVIIGWPTPTDKNPGPLILKHGQCKSLKIAKLAIENFLPKSNEQLTWMAL